MPKKTLQEALSQKLTPEALDTEIVAANVEKLGNPMGKVTPDILVSCIGCGAVFTKSKIEKDPPGSNPPAPTPSPAVVLARDTTCPCCLQTQGWREIADVRFRSVDTT